MTKSILRFRCSIRPNLLRWSTSWWCWGKTSPIQDTCCCRSSTDISYFDATAVVCRQEENDAISNSTITLLSCTHIHKYIHMCSTSKVGYGSAAGCHPRVDRHPCWRLRRGSKLGCCFFVMDGIFLLSLLPSPKMRGRELAENRCKIDEQWESWLHWKEEGITQNKLLQIYYSIWVITPHLLELINNHSGFTGTYE